VKAAKEWVMLADSGGRPTSGWKVGAPRGPAGHLYQVKPIKLGKPALEHGRTPDPTKWRAFLPEFFYGHSSPAHSWTWTLKPAGRIGLIVRIDSLPMRVLVMAGEQVVGGFDPDSGSSSTVFLEVGKQIGAGRTAIKLVSLLNEPLVAKLDMRDYVRTFDAVANLTAKAEWSFASWSMPVDDAFAKGSPPRGQPCWFRAGFKAANGSELQLHLKGMSRGQAYLNGRSLGRYGGPAQPHREDPFLLPLPSPWLAPGDGENHVTLFDEEGKSPRGVRLVAE
jgi:hypothetical protein